MEYAEYLLRQGNISVAEVANQVGYANPGHFAAAFKRRFCITPRMLYVICAVCMFLVGLVGFSFPLLRNLEKTIPDHDEVVV